ncbi:hypothetical protein SO802_031046 [Lithocarpus litseifolius]|uniref:RNase H type-1 domain-containing protein n=1 Tax=Lithocarpus litseifolius TaxID=425828 RepID=A0AAW2BMM9_9ROSI
MGCPTTEEDSDFESVASDPEIQAIYTSQPTLVSLASPIPISQVHILLDSYSRPTPVIALFDTGAVADMEAIAATRTLEFAREIGITDAILEGDSCLVHHALTMGEQSLSPFGLLVEDVKVSSTSSRTLLYSHTKRESNNVAYGLARHAIHLSDYVV